MRRTTIVPAVLLLGAVLLFQGGLAAQEAKRSVEFRPDVEYGRGGEETLRLNLALPGAPEKRPCIVFIHGGAWAAGNRKDLDFVVKEAAQRGYVAATVSYRLCPKHPFPAQVEDVKCAVRYLRAHADELHIDKDKFGAFGFSAGAHLAMMLGVMDPEDGLEGEGGWPDQPSKVQAVVSYFGPTDLEAELPPVSVGLVNNFIGGTKEEMPDAYKRASPLTYVTKGDAPMLLFQGTKDRLVPYAQAWVMTEALTKKEVPGKVEFLVGVDHGWGGKDLERSQATSWAFLDKHLRGLP